MRILHDSAYPGSGRNAPVLAILLPGALMGPEDLLNAGMVDAVRRRGLPIDLALVDPGLRYIAEATDGTALERLEHNAMSTALHEPYREIWLAGLSIGGFMAMAYAARYPGRATGLCLLAPYPGNRMLTGEIRAAGGIAGWQAQTGEHGMDDEGRVWRWLARRAQETEPEIHMGYGSEDRFSAGQELMAQALATHYVDIVPGAHDWPAWRRLWENFLDRTASRFHRLAAQEQINRTA